MQMQLAIVMPAYNEEGCIAKVIDSWTGLLKQSGFTPKEAGLVLVNDGSKDKTGAIMDEVASHNPYLRPVHQKNGGHGVALMTAYRHAVQLGAEWVFHVDSDDQFVTHDFFALWAQREKSDFILGFRRTRHDSLHRLVITRIVRVLNLALFGVWIPDANIPYRLIRGSFLRALLSALDSRVFAPNIFLAILAAKSGQNLVNIPVHHEERKTGTVSILRLKLLKVCFQSAKELLAFRSSLPRKIEALQKAARPHTLSFKRAG